jgi:hypothetical protein
LPQKRKKPETSLDSLPSKSLPPAKELPLDLNKYKTIPESSKLALSEHIEHLHSSSLSQLPPLLPENKTRHQIRVKIRCALSLAHEEQKNSVLEVSKFPSLSEVAEKIEKLSISIESAIFLNTGENAKSSEYSKKVRAVLFNLTQEKNLDFRRGVLKGEIEPKDICKMESRDMASSEIKNFRKERQKMYSKEQLIIPETAQKLVLKSRKGEAVIDVNKQRDSEEFIGSLLEGQWKRLDQEFSSECLSSEGLFSDLNFEETIKEWAGDKVLVKIEEKLTQNLPTVQSARILSRIFSLKSKKNIS